MGEESALLVRLVGEPLKICLKDVLETRPHDPIEHIAHWLYNYVDNRHYFMEKYSILKDLEEEYRRMQKEKKLLSENKKKLSMQIKAINAVSSITDPDDFDAETKKYSRGTNSRGSHSRGSHSRGTHSRGTHCTHSRDSHSRGSKSRGSPREKNKDHISHSSSNQTPTTSSPGEKKSSCFGYKLTTTD